MATPRLPISRQVLLLIDHLKRQDMREPDDPALAEIVQWVKDAPKAAIPESLHTLICEKFQLQMFQLKNLLTGSKLEEFDELVPKQGWLRDYIEWTRQTEPPTVFHFFAGMVSIGSAMSRNVFFDMGAYQIFPNLCVVVVAPSGRCKKTSACNLAVGLYRNIGGNVLQDKVTPEALISAFQDKTSACGLIYAPELAVFLGKQRYNEGMVPLLTALFDCPKEWSSLTIMRGESKLYNVALSFLACSTMDWIQTAIPRDAFGGGFMSRLLFVVQNDTPRVFPIPPPLKPEMSNKLKAHLFELTRIRGKFKIDKEAEAWYDHWYRHKSEGLSAEKQFAGYLERKGDHLFRIAMVLTLAELPIKGKEEGLVLTKDRLTEALKILNWIEGHLPNAFEQMSTTQTGEEHSRMVKQLRNAGGALGHSEWLRKNSNRMDQRAFKMHVDTLRMSRLVDYDSSTKLYYLTPEGWSRI